MVERVNKLVSEGKTYNIYYKKNKYCNITLQTGRTLTTTMAAAILRDMARQYGSSMPISTNYVTFEEAEPEFD